MQRDSREWPTCSCVSLACPISCGRVSPGRPGRPAGCPGEQGRCGRGSRSGSHTEAGASLAGTRPALGGFSPPRPRFLGSFRSQQCFPVSSCEAEIRLPVTFALVMSFAATQSKPESFSVTLSPRLGEPATMPAFPSRCEKPLASWPSPSPGNLWVPQSLDHLVTSPRHALHPRPMGLPTCAVSCEAPERVGISRRQ